MFTTACHTGSFPPVAMRPVGGCAHWARTDPFSPGRRVQPRPRQINVGVGVGEPPILRAPAGESRASGPPHPGQVLGGSRAVTEGSYAVETVR